MKIFNVLDDSKTRIAAGFLLLGLLFIQLFVVACTPRQWQTLLHEICLTIMLLVLGLTLAEWKKVLIPLLIILIALQYISKFLELDVLNNIVMLCNIVLLFTVIGIYIRQTFLEQKVNATVIFQSINGYLLLGLASSLLIIIILRYDAAAFSFPEAYYTADIKLVEAQYFSLVTISTLGYGDIIPLAPIARSTTTFIAVSGQLYVAIIIALLVGKFSKTQPSK